MDSSSKSTDLVKKSKLEAALMPPPPKRIKRPSTVLDEDTYLDGLSHIIARDYFPDLVQTEAKEEFLDALDSKDDTWIQDAGQRLHQVLQGKASYGRRGVTLPTQTPIGLAGDTPLSTVESRPNQKVDLDMSLTAFQAKYTSEDNESFSALIDKQNLKNREKHAYLWTGNNIPSKRLLAHREREAKLLESSSQSTELQLYNKDTRPAMPNCKPSAPRNTLMFIPDSIEDTHTTISQSAEAKSNAPPKAIRAERTRLGEEAPPVPPSPSLSAINDAIAGRPRLSESEAGWETPRVGGYSFVDADPTDSELRAYERPTTDAAALLGHLTRGVADGAKNPFNIKEAGKREQLHHKLVDKSNESKRLKLGRMSDLLDSSTPGRTPTPKFGSASTKAGSLTPAGRMLYDKVKVTPRQVRMDGAKFDGTPLRRDKKGLLPGLTPKPGASKLRE